MAKTSKVDIANAKIGTNSADAAANASVIAVVDARVNGNGAGVKDLLAIGVASDCLERAEETAV